MGDILIFLATGLVALGAIQSGQFHRFLTVLILVALTFAIFRFNDYLKARGGSREHSKVSSLVAFGGWLTYAGAMYGYSVLIA